MKRISIWIIVLCVLIGGGGLIWVDNPLVPAPTQADRLTWSVGLLLASLALVFLDGIGGWASRVSGLQAFAMRWNERSTAAVRPSRESVQASNLAGLDNLPAYLRLQRNLFWRRSTRLILVVGEPEQIEAIAPSLAQQHWLEAQGSVLIWGGSVQQRILPEVCQALLKLRSGRPVDAVVWALTPTQRDDYNAFCAGTRHLHDLGQTLRWQPPLYLWQVCYSLWSQDDRLTQKVGCLFGRNVRLTEIEASLQDLVIPLRDQGLAQMLKVNTHDFLVRLSYKLERTGIANWCTALKPVLGELHRSAPLRGLVFSLPHRHVPTPGLPHLLQTDATWDCVLDDHSARGRLCGWHPLRVAYLSAMAAALALTIGMLVSYTSNRAQIATIPWAALQSDGDAQTQVFALHELTRELDRLEYQHKHGAPWHQRFFLNPNAQLRETLWPLYADSNHRLLRDVAQAGLETQLNALLALPPGTAARAEAAQKAYDPLKAYLMMGHPDKVEPAFLAATLQKMEPKRDGISTALWQTLAPNLWRFYAEQLPSHLDWAIPLDAKLVAQARQVMLGQLGQRNGEAALYLEVLDQARSHYPDVGLDQLTGDTDARPLFHTARTVPGVFTRQAWEGHVRQAIDHIAEARREQIDWVLSDQQTDAQAGLSPDALKAHLTERYFDDFSGVWLSFLNSLRWQPAKSLPDVIDQLTLMSDVRQSPLIGLVNTLEYQGQTGAQGRALADSLIQSAQQLVGHDKVAALAPQLIGPLDNTFGPLKPLTDNSTLHAFLTRVTRVRLQLQHISNAPDPQAMTQALAQSVFQGKTIDLTDTREAGSLLAASLGTQWGGLGQNLFVQPLTQAWQSVLQPSAASLNRQWQRNIVAHWDSAFSGRYPFAATPSDASLPMLGAMVRSGTGRIEQFLASQLGGVLRKEGNRWVADSANSQGLRFNPEFIKAMDQLTHLADVLYTDGDLGLHFDLQAKPITDVVQTTFVLNGRTMEYFNQRESWQRFPWPGRSDYPGVRLTWTSVNAGPRLYGDFDGTWGLIRWLEQAKVTALDDSDTRFQLVLKAPDGLGLTWHLRTDLGHGPLTLLKLRGFKLPQQIFVSR